MNKITQEYLKSLFSYDPETGLFTRIVPIGNRAIGDIAGTKNLGYIYIQINRKIYAAHRLAFLYMTGSFPRYSTDHINLVRSDNRWCNLRLATDSQNGLNRKMQINNTLKIKGVSKNGTGYLAQTQLNGKHFYLGTFRTTEEASEAYQEFAKQHHGEFYRSQK